MPTVCEPWPGKTKANGDIRRSVVAATPSGRITCSLATDIPAPYPAATMSDDRPGRVVTRPVTRPAPTRIIARRFEQDSSAPVLAAGSRIRNVPTTQRAGGHGSSAMAELGIGFASQLGELRLGFTQLAALYVLADGSTLTVGELAESITCSPSATSRLIDGLVKRRLVERKAEEEESPEGPPPDPARACRATGRRPWPGDQFLSAVRPLPTAERAIVAMGVAALATYAISRRGRLDPGAARGHREQAQAPHGGTAVIGSTRNWTFDCSIATATAHGARSSPSHTRPPRSIWSAPGRGAGSTPARPATSGSWWHQSTTSRHRTDREANRRRRAADGLRYPQKRRTTSYRTGSPNLRASRETRPSTPWKRSGNRSSGSRRSGEKPGRYAEERGRLRVGGERHHDRERIASGSSSSSVATRMSHSGPSAGDATGRPTR